MKSNAIARYLETEKALQEAQNLLKQYISKDINISDIYKVKQLNYLTDLVIRREEMATIAWNHLSDKQMDKVIAKKSA